jgi:hypothetical protein
MDKKIFFDKLFPRKPGLNRYELQMDYECVSYITMPRDSEKICQLISHILEKYNKNISDATIVDGTACVGGDTITFCSSFGTVIPIEINEDRYKHLLHNLKMYDVKNAFPILGNCMDMINDIQINIDCCYLDPPWGGKDYKQFEKIELKLDNKDIDEIIISLLSKGIKLVVLKLPKNYNYEKLLSKLGDYTITINKEIKKIDILFAEKKI